MRWRLKLKIVLVAGLAVVALAVLPAPTANEAGVTGVKVALVCANQTCVQL